MRALPSGVVRTPVLAPVRLVPGAVARGDEGPLPRTPAGASPRGLPLRAGVALLREAPL